MIPCPVCSVECHSIECMLAQCPRCDHVFDPSLRSSVPYDQSYLDTYKSYPTELMSTIRVALLKTLITEGKILDIGYGNGSFLKLAKTVGYETAGHDVHGVPCGVRDVDPWVSGEVWDAICMFDSIEHFGTFDALRRLFECSRIVLVSTPCRDSVSGRISDWKHFKPGEHLHYFSAKSLKTLIGKNVVFDTDVEDMIRRSELPGRNIMTVGFRA